MDEIVKIIGNSSICTYCGVFRRQALEKGAAILNATKLATGHNADDMAETVILNFLRGDHFRLSKCVDVMTADDEGFSLPRFKPFKYTYEKEIVMYAHHKKLHYFSVECTYTEWAYRSFVRDFLKDLERNSPGTILDIMHAGELIDVKEDGKVAKLPSEKFKCSVCGSLTNKKICKGCLLLQQLSKAKPKIMLETEKPEISKQI